MQLKSFTFAVTLILYLSAAVRAAVSYSYVTDRSAYSGAVGTPVTVSIYLDETLTVGSSSVITSDGGLTGAGAAINVASTTGGTAAMVTGNSFSFPATFAGPRGAFYNQGQGGNNLEFDEGIAGGTSGLLPSSGLILLGAVNITVGSGTTTYALTSLFADTINNSNSMLGQGNGYTLTKSFDLDVTNGSLYTGADAATPFDFTVSPAPEPTGGTILIGGALLIARRRRARFSTSP